MKILLVSLSFLGDTILSTPLIPLIKERYPNCTLWFCTTKLSAPLIQFDPELAGVLIFDKRGKHGSFSGFCKFVAEIQAHQFDIVYSLHRSFRTSLLLWFSKIHKRIGFEDAVGSFLYTERIKKMDAPHAVQRYASLLLSENELKNKELTLQLSLDPHITKTLPERYIVLVPGSEWETKRWHAEGYRSAMFWCIEQGYTVILLGSQKEWELSDFITKNSTAINLCGKTTIQEFLYYIKHASAVVCNDSMTLHAASAFQVPVVTIFCATSPSFGFGPWKHLKSEVVEEEHLSCKPCRRHGSRACPTGTELCMTLSPLKVVTALKKYV